MVPGTYVLLLFSLSLLPLSSIFQNTLERARFRGREVFRIVALHTRELFQIILAQIRIQNNFSAVWVAKRLDNAQARK